MLFVLCSIVLLSVMLLLLIYAAVLFCIEGIQLVNSVLSKLRSDNDYSININTSEALTTEIIRLSLFRHRRMYNKYPQM